MYEIRTLSEMKVSWTSSNVLLKSQLGSIELFWIECIDIQLKSLVLMKIPDIKKDALIYLCL